MGLEWHFEESRLNRFTWENVSSKDFNEERKGGGNLGGSDRYEGYV